ncbi:MAG: hypothetical protein HY351_00525 [Candidatus Omnitrophica bacterium]|nr:hypothetical protein [Candidatus Omnitrophota bacterium]
MRRLFWILLTSSFFALGVLQAEMTSNSKQTLPGISPVYEEMLANEVVLLWRGLVKEGTLKPEAPFLIAGWGQDDEPLALKVAESLEQKHDLQGHWEAVSFQDWKETRENTPFQGVIFINLDSNKATSKKGSFLEVLKEAAAFIGSSENEGFLVMFIRGYMNHAWLESTVEEAGLKLKAVLKPYELEFVEDELGRQTVDLDFPKWRNMIYERFVREGMNPVAAHPQTDEAIEYFRKSQEPKILIAGKDKT